MSILSSSLPKDLEDFVIAQAKRDGYASPDEFLSVLIREEQTRQAKRELDVRLQAALDGGPASPMTRDDWDALEVRVRERQTAGPDRS